MRTKSKILLSSIMSLALLFTNVSPAFAKNKEENVDKAAQLSTKNLKAKKIDKSQLPEGMIPLEFSSVEEAKNYLSGVNDEIEKNNAQTKVKQSKLSNAQIDVLSKDEFDQNFAMLAASTGTQTKRTGIGNLVTYVTCRVQYTYSGSYFLSVSSISSYLTGITLGWGWIPGGSYSSLIDGRRTIAVTYWGVLKGYLLINSDLFEISSEDIQNYDEFYL